MNNAAAFRGFYKEQRVRLAMAVGQERDPTAISMDHWNQFARDIRVRPDLVHEKLTRMATLMRVEVVQLRHGLRGTPADSPLLDLVVEDVARRCGAVLDMIRPADWVLRKDPDWLAMP